MTLDTILDQADDLAEAGDVQAALALLEQARRTTGHSLSVRDRARLELALGTMVARSGALTTSLALLQLAEATAHQAEATAVALEARVTHSSVLGALGRYAEAIPALAGAVADLQRLHPGTELLAEARAELEAFQTMVSPTGQAAVSALQAKQG